MKRIGLLLLCLALLTGCTASPAALLPMRPLPTVEDPYAPPVGDAGLTHETVVTLYLPSTDGQKLLALYQTMELTWSRHPAESVVRALLAHPGSDRVRSLGGGVNLTLTGTDPVVVAGEVCTVDLSPSALQLSLNDLHTLCTALTATLCELEGIRCVNVLVAGQALAMDVMGTLPLGTMSAQPGQELPVLYEQLTARRTPVGVEPATVPLTATATLYFPLADGRGILPAARRLSFPGQHPQQLILALMDALAVGPDGTSLPDLAAMLLSAPEITDLTSGGRRVTLHFVPDVRQRIEAAGVDPACCFAGLVCTLTGFVPSVQQVCIRVGDGALTSLHNEFHPSLLFPGGLHARADYAAYLTARSPLWHRENGALSPTVAALPYRQAHDPRALLLALASLPEAEAVLPAGLTDADILGFALQDDTLLIHLSARYAEAIHVSGMDQQMMAYAIVGTMCDNLSVRRVRFYFGNAAVSDLGSDLVWDGEFLHDPGLLRRGPSGGDP